MSKTGILKVLHEQCRFPTAPPPTTRTNFETIVVLYAKQVWRKFGLSFLGTNPINNDKRIFQNNYFHYNVSLGPLSSFWVRSGKWTHRYRTNQRRVQQSGRSQALAKNSIYLQQKFWQTLASNCSVVHPSQVSLQQFPDTWPRQY